MAVIKPASAVTPIGGQGLGGKTRHSNATQVALPVGAIASGDTMTIAHLPHHARLLGLIVKNDSGVALNFSLGTAADAVAFRDAGALANGVAETTLKNSAVLVRYSQYPTTPVIATFGAAATIPAGGNVKIAFEYIVDEPFLP